MCLFVTSAKQVIPAPKPHDFCYLFVVANTSSFMVGIFCGLDHRLLQAGSNPKQLLQFSTTKFAIGSMVKILARL